MAAPPFEQFLENHRGPVYRFLVASVGGEHADDCFQETFLAALRAYPRLRDDSNPKAWIFTIAHRKALDLHRTRRRAPLPVDDLADRAAADGDAGTDPSLWEAVAGLPPKQSAAVALRFVADLPYREIGHAMDTSEAAARRNVHEGLTTLRKAWRG